MEPTLSVLSPVSLLTHVVRPALALMGEPYDSVAAEQLLIGTAAQESGGFLYLRQTGAGPALGIFQIEPETYHDLWDRCPTKLRPVLVACAGSFSPPPDLVAWNHKFGAMMARLKYRDDSLPLPVPGNVQGLGWSWKHGYNSVKGAGTVEQFVFSWRRYVAPYQAELWP